MVAKSFVAPFDRIKILYQISSAEFHIMNVPKVAVNIVRTEGLQALWKGNTATMIRVFPYSGIQFMIFDRCKTFLLREQEMAYVQQKLIDPLVPKPAWGLSPMQSLMSGMLAGASSVCVTYPLDLTRAQLAVLRRKNDSTNLRFYQIIGQNYSNRVCRLQNLSSVLCSQFFLTSIRSSSFVFVVGTTGTFSGNYTNDDGNTSILRNRICCQRTNKEKGEWVMLLNKH